MSKKEKRFSYELSNTLFGEVAMIIVDNRTGVNYLHTSGTGGLCPLYNVDGTLIVTPVEKIEEK
ncbi:hypothetical protein M2139_000565 [Enterococcus sp. PF1-24]|uniref:DUF6440 family protein n=1 Tax=unclassified Enterococcus TaxID=2608891 RepID=UPI002472FF5B|nr:MULTISPECIES: DUF6440 family protein [unclassified Enterococcus]MDH6363728.1 hypothetical protein [Enterococcus sp. PFB1-1]MDH6400684.1 hypothetical protein [Enterococcus sp. PF1-24]